MWSTLVVLGAAILSANAAPAKRDDIPALSGIVSSGCQTTLESLINSPAATCLNLPGTLAIFSTVSNSSWIPPTNTWLSSFCAADPCTDDQITSTVGTAADGCTAEIAELGVTKDFLIQEATQYFSTAKSAACLRDSSNHNDLCAITTLQKFEDAMGLPLTPTNVIARYHDVLETNDTLARELACTPCGAAAFSLLQPALSQSQDITNYVNSFVDFMCGPDFASTEATGSISVVTGTAAQVALQATGTTSGSYKIQAPGLVIGFAGILSLVASLL